MVCSGEMRGADFELPSNNNNKNPDVLKEIICFCLFGWLCYVSRCVICVRGGMHLWPRLPGKGGVLPEEGGGGFNLICWGER